MTKKTATLTLAAVLGALTLAAVDVAAQPAAGTWDARWASGIRTERDGTITVQRELDAVLTLQQDADSLVGEWTFEIPGSGHSLWRVHGRAEGGRIRLVATESEIENPPPPSQGRIVRQEWSGTIGDGRIEGDMWLVLRLPDGTERRSGPRPWSAERRDGARRSLPAARRLLGRGGTTAHSDSRGDTPCPLPK